MIPLIPNDDISDLPYTQTVSYIDTIHIGFMILPTAADIRLLKKLCKSVKLRTRDPMKHYYPVLYKYKLELHVPSKYALMYLQKRYSDLYSVSRVDVALDLVTQNVFDALYIKKWTGWRIPKQSKRKAEWYISKYDSEDYIEECTLYSPYDLEAEKQYVIYADRPSKITNDPCCHIEVRIRRNIPRFFVCQRNGILRRLANLDYKEFWSQHLTLKDVTEESVGLAVIRDVFKRKARKGKKLWDYIDAFGRTRNNLKKNGAYFLHANPKVRSLAHLHDQGIEMKHFKKLDITPILPCNDGV